MDLIQDENASKGKYSTKRDSSIISKIENEYSYNKLFMQYLISKEKEKIKRPKINFQAETIVDNIISMDEVRRIASNPNKLSLYEESRKYENEESLGVDWEGELISYADELKKLMKEKKGTRGEN